jgi:hypothetical protein
MKTGLENKRNVAILTVLLVVMAVVVVRFVKDVFIGGAPPPAATAASTAAPAAMPPAPQRRTVAPGTSGPAARRLPSLGNLDPTLHPELMAGAESLEYTGNGRNIFSMSSVPVQRNIEQAKGPVRPNGKMNVAQAPQGPPPPPPIDLTFFGFEAGNGMKQAFLLHGNDVYIAREGEVVDHHYKILRINPLSIEVMDLLYNNTQTLPLVQGLSS